MGEAKKSFFGKLDSFKLPSNKNNFGNDKLSRRASGLSGFFSFLPINNIHNSFNLSSLTVNSTVSSLSLTNFLALSHSSNKLEFLEENIRWQVNERRLK